VRCAGPHGSVYVGMSSDKASENLAGRKSKVSWGRVVLPGLGDDLRRGRKA
jgi:hypothetical protein